MNAQKIRESVHQFADEIVATRRDLHQHPELGFEEARTSDVIAQRLQRDGLEVRAGIVKTGVVGIVRGERPGKTLLIRADIDALPIEEVEDRPYRSQHPGRMHA